MNTWISIRNGVATIFLAASLSSCYKERSMAAGSSYDTYSGDGLMQTNELRPWSDEQQAPSGTSADPTSGMRIYHASMGLRVKNADSATVALAAVASQYGGYVARADRYCVTLKVKAENLDQAMNEAAALGKVLRRSVSVEDVTAQYNDLGVRLENAEKARSRYLELLAKAENVEAALLVEKELERLNLEIDSIKGQKNMLEHEEKFSSLEVYLDQKEKLGVLGYVFVGIYKGVAWLFVRG